MVKPEWGTKRTCAKCGTRFYDLNKEDPVTCIECGEEWTPEPVLKSKQPIPFEEEKKKKDEEADSDLGGDDDLEDLAVDDDEDSPDNEVDLGGDDDLGVETKSKGDDDNDDS
ncbi:TIGR02300 family protein [Qipengyuania zhejiangensis]|uniref:TIGR02300 family protein n=1 Tax=Qipengyuania zhejiangensis TaxID=3077782 RepID=UPI002D78160E|nr:TIGR02300 family protein [Qipengyuania sp. Z2]